VNPRVGVALTKCFYCGEGDRILINKLLTESMAKRVESAHGCVIDMEPCNKCKEFMDKGVILITIDDAKSGANWNTPPPDKPTNWMPNPYRTGGFFVVTDDAVKRIINNESTVEWALKHRWMFIDHEAAERIGLFAHAKGTQ
jgi:hypothetical protein